MPDVPNMPSTMRRNQTRRVALVVSCCALVIALTATVILLLRAGEPSTPVSTLAPDEACIVVRVLTADGQPADGVFVGVAALQLSDPVREDAGEPEQFVPRNGEHLTVDAIDVKKAHTDTDGTASVTVRAPLLDVLVSAVSGADIASDGPIQLRRGETVRTELRLGLGLIAVGKVVDPTGAPLANVQLHLSRVGVNALDLTQVGARADGVSGTDGSFRLGPIENPSARGEVEILAFTDGQPTPTPVVLPAWRGESEWLTITVPELPR